MQITYDNKEVEKIFTDYNKMKKKIGELISRVVKKRMNALDAADNMSTFLLTGLGNPHTLKGNEAGYIAISLTANFRLIIRPEPKDLDPNALKICNVVVVKGVDDYHGSKNNWLIP